MTGQSILELIMLLGIFMAVLALTYVVTKKVGLMNQKRTVHRNMQIIEVLQVAPGQYLQIVKVGETYHLIGSSQKGQISYWTKLEEGQLNLSEAQPTAFSEELSKLMKEKWGNKHGKK